MSAGIGPRPSKYARGAHSTSHSRQHPKEGVTEGTQPVERAIEGTWPAGVPLVKHTQQAYLGPRNTRRRSPSPTSAATFLGRPCLSTTLTPQQACGPRSPVLASFACCQALNRNLSKPGMVATCVHPHLQARSRALGFHPVGTAAFLGQSRACRHNTASSQATCPELPPCPQSRTWPSRQQVTEAAEPGPCVPLPVQDCTTRAGSTLRQLRQVWGPDSSRTQRCRRMSPPSSAPTRNLQKAHNKHKNLINKSPLSAMEKRKTEKRDKLEAGLVGAFFAGCQPGR